ncbi:hypothetical protein [Streptomyces sp. NBC_01465]|nr:hypothetical protein [Streptomyces sp. NBC_01465]
MADTTTTLDNAENPEELARTAVLETETELLDTTLLDTPKTA